MTVKISRIQPGFYQVINQTNGFVFGYVRRAKHNLWDVEVVGGRKERAIHGLESAKSKALELVADLTGQKEFLFQVTIRVTTGDIQKDVTTYRVSESADRAQYAALLGQSHCDHLDFDEWKNGEDWEDINGEFIYTIASCYAVPEPLASVMMQANEAHPHLRLIK